jgi:hypothetical protein
MPKIKNFIIITEEFIIINEAFHDNNLFILVKAS